MSKNERRATLVGSLLAAALMMGAIGATGPANAVEPSPSPAGTAAEHPAGTLQRLVDETPDGGQLSVPPGIYRETLILDRPVQVDGEGGAEIRGSDVWAAWAADDGRWLSEEPVPALETGGVCREERCAWPEQVFLDGTPLLQVAADPAVGEFALDAGRRVILADDPAGRTVEVTTRPTWVEVGGPDVGIAGFTMRHAASPAQHGALQAREGGDRLVVSDVVLEDAHGALASFQDVAGASLVDSLLRRGGQLGVHAGGRGTQDLTVARTEIVDNNTEGFDPEWEAGGLKAALATGLILEDNVVERNGGAGLWCDIDCRDVRYVGNRVSHNEGAGIMFEISDGAVIEDNVVWENGWAGPAWGWGAGILVSSSTDVVVRGNVVAHNADGVSVISQRRDRTQGDAVHDVRVEGNTIVVGPAGGFLLAWLQDWDGPMFADGSANAGASNTFWLADGDRTTCPFEWDGCRRSVEEFSSTPGGRDSRLLSPDGGAAALAAVGLDASPAPHVVPSDPFRPRELLRPSFLVPAGLAISFGAVALVVLVIAWRRRRSRATS